MRKSYTFKELSEIGRKEFNLSDDWHCFTAEVSGKGKGDKLKYGLSPQDENGKWLDKEVYGYVTLNVE